MNKGIWYGIGAYALWGFFPIYWKFLHQVSALQVIGHRIAWSFILLIIDRKSTRLNSSHIQKSRMPSSA